VRSAGFEPKVARLSQGIDTASLPPCDFVRTVVNLAVMNAAQGHGKLITYLAADGAVLREAKVVGIRRVAAADEAWLFGNKFDVGLVPNSARLGKGQFVFVDDTGFG
jgi:hypothetical protein